MSNLDQALAQAIDRYRHARPASERIFNDATLVLPGGNTRSVLFFAPFPPAMVRGEGCWLWDADGHRYLDALGEFTAGLYGHSEPAIRAAIAEALEGGLSLSSHTAREGALAREVQRRFPAMELMRFTNSGTEANLMALASACAHTGRRKVLVFKGGYHGGVLAFAGGGSPVNVPHEWIVARYNDLADVLQRVAPHRGELGHQPFGGSPALGLVGRVADVAERRRRVHHEGEVGGAGVERHFAHERGEDVDG